MEQEIVVRMSTKPELDDIAFEQALRAFIQDFAAVNYVYSIDWYEHDRG